jgi:hypothetical protein
MQRFRIGLPLALAVFGACCSEALAEDFKTACERLVQGVPNVGRVIEATFVPTGPVALPPPAPPGATAPAPDHCLIRGKIDERIGVDGKPYAIGDLQIPS